MKNLVRITFLICIIGSTLWMLRSNKQIETTIWVTEMEESYDLYLQNFEISLKSMNVLWPEILDLTDNPVFSELQEKQQPILVLRVKETNCTFCIEKELQRIEEKDKSIECLVLASYSNIRHINILTKDMENAPSYINISFNSFDNWPIEEFEAPYYFILHPDRRVTNFFLPDKLFPETTQQYLEAASKLVE